MSHTEEACLASSLTWFPVCFLVSHVIHFLTPGGNVMSIVDIVQSQRSILADWLQRKKLYVWGADFFFFFLEWKRLWEDRNIAVCAFPHCKILPFLQRHLSPENPLLSWEYIWSKEGFWMWQKVPLKLTLSHWSR